MIAHIVLFRPKPDITDADRAAMFDALRAAATEIASVRRFHVGNRITHGRSYEQVMAVDYAYAAVVEFDDLIGLEAYLQHPKHERLGALFYQLSEAALVYDYALEAVGVDQSLRN